jgi:hypothetical protein
MDWPMRTIGSGKKKTDYTMSETVLFENDGASEIHESRPESHEHSREAQYGNSDNLENPKHVLYR